MRDSSIRDRLRHERVIAGIRAWYDAKEEQDVDLPSYMDTAPLAVDLIVDIVAWAGRHEPGLVPADLLAEALNRSTRELFSHGLS